MGNTLRRKICADNDIEQLPDWFCLHGQRNVYDLIDGKDLDGLEVEHHDLAVRDSCSPET